MTALRLKEIEEMVAKLLVTAGKLPAVQDRHNAFKETGRFRARIAGLRRTELRSAHRKLKATGNEAFSPARMQHENSGIS
jgi:hypothetical protein